MKNKNRTPLELYIHIPFCVQKCQYCDFLSGPSDQETRDRYIKALRAEIQAVQGVEAYEIVSVFIGGGTPSVLKAEAIASIMETIQKKFCFSPDAEITIESNPGTVDLAKLNAYRETGINRLSLGLQSTDSKELRMLGRIHTYEEFLQSYQWAREAGFQNINIDLMFAIPGQTGEAWRAHLRQVAELKPEHISAYSLIIEEGTPFAECELDLPDETRSIRCMRTQQGFLQSMDINNTKYPIMQKTDMHVGIISVTGNVQNILAWGWEHLLFMGKTVFPIREICRNIWDFPETQNEFVKMF